MAIEEEKQAATKPFDELGVFHGCIALNPSGQRVETGQVTGRQVIKFWTKRVARMDDDEENTEAMEMSTFNLTNMQGTTSEPSPSKRKAKGYSVCIEK
ncbi:hypothetical protein DVH24_034207 [Malus domestica]|uniref:Uncharacterized protein n=1 Tax=Malus domestica TaxID=3750 RepID=A0A498I6X9_MALDO|nr:hypothetical protein DVH24_034207 [Malus domestica]